MPADPYAPCPCGSGKKLKFCCGAQWPELEKIERLLESGQDLAALEAIQRLEAKLPDHPHLLYLKIDLLTVLGRQEEAEAACDTLIAKHPDNAHARYYAALRLSRDGQLSAALRAWYTALREASHGGVVSPTALMSGQMLAIAATSESATVASRSMMNLLSAIVPDDDGVKQLGMRLRAAESPPLLLKELPRLREHAAEARWEPEFAAALAPAGNADYPSSESLFTALTGKAATDAAAWFNLAVLRVVLADLSGASQAYAKLAECSTDWNEAVEAEALSALYRSDPEGEVVERFHGALQVDYFDRVMELLSAHRRLPRVADALIDHGDGSAPPPRAVFSLLDRPQTAYASTSTYADIPTIVAHVALFGRETDRPARLEVEAIGADRFDQAVESLREATREPLPLLGEREIRDSMPVEELAMTWAPWMPPETPADEVTELFRNQQLQALRDIWPRTPNWLLNGRTPAEAAADNSQQRAVAAALLVEEGDYDTRFPPSVFDELSAQLGVPALGKVDPKPRPGEAVGHVPLVRLSRVEATKYNDEELLAAFQRAAAYNAGAAIWNLGQEVVGRPTLNDLDRARAFTFMASATSDSKKAIECLLEAQRLTVAAKKSPAHLLLLELRLRWQRREGKELERILHTLHTRHRKEHGVMQSLGAFLVELGLIGPDGRPRTRAPESSLVVPGEEEPAGKLWTPESETAAAGKSALWVPGME